jgi:hypothetical protein
LQSKTPGGYNIHVIFSMPSTTLRDNIIFFLYILTGIDKAIVENAYVPIDLFMTPALNAYVEVWHFAPPGNMPTFSTSFLIIAP